MAPRKIERKDTQFERQITYGKRSKGLLKKAFELSVLCDVDVALIMYAPNDRLRHFSNKKLERLLQEYIQHQTTISETNAGEVDNSVKRPVISQDTIEKINRFVGQVDMADQQGLEANKEEINEETKKLTMLQELQKKLIPNMGTSRSIHELEERKRFLVEALHKIEQKKTTILSRFNIGISPHFSQPNLLLQTGEQLQQEYQKEIETPFVAQPQDMQQFNVPPLLREPFEISKDPWSLDDIVNQNMSQEEPVPGLLSDHFEDMQQFNVPPLLPEPFEISKDPWSLDDIVNQNMSQEKPASKLLSDHFEDLYWLLQTNEDGL